MYIKEQLKKILRIFRIWKIAISLIIILWWDNKAWTYPGGKSKAKIEKRELIRARWLTKELLSLGSAFVKLGQLLSARPDVLPYGWINELSALQDNVPSFSFTTAKNLLRQELGKDYDLILNLQEIPLGAASLAQVHLATLKDGREIVLKIQRPNIEKICKLDLSVMSQIAGIIQINSFR